MTRYVERSDIVDLDSYESRRDELRARILEVKASRRVHLGEYLTFLFENRETMAYQVQEIVRAEKIRGESAIRHEIDVYNSLLGGEGDIGCVLLIEIPDAAQRKPLLQEWLGLEASVYVGLEDGTRVYADHDEGQVGTDRLSAVQYLRFAVDGAVPVAVGTDFPALVGEVELTSAQKEALAADLAA